MSRLDIHASKYVYDQILLGQIKMPNFKAILHEEVKAFVYNVSYEEGQKIISDPQEPLFMRWLNDPTDKKIPVFKSNSLRNDIGELAQSRTLLINEEDESTKTGVLSTILSEDNDELLCGRFECNFEKNTSFQGGWSSIFTQDVNQSNKKFLLPYSNSIVINDSYLFKNITKDKKNLGIENLLNLLHIIMPKNCDVEFQISIITSDARWDFETAKKQFNTIYSQITNHFSYPIFFELVIWNSSENHKRILVSNYYTAITDKGFDLFNDDNKVVDRNDITIRRIFHDVRQPGDSPYKQSLERLKYLKKTYYDARNYCLNNSQMVGKIYMSSGSDNNKINRLIGPV